jgi:hypothetical protein
MILNPSDINISSNIQEFTRLLLRIVMFSPKCRYTSIESIALAKRTSLNDKLIENLDYNIDSYYNLYCGIMGLYPRRDATLNEIILFHEKYIDSVKSWRRVSDVISWMKNKGRINEY